MRCQLTEHFVKAYKYKTEKYKTASVIVCLSFPSMSFITPKLKNDLLCVKMKKYNIIFKTRKQIKVSCFPLSFVKYASCF